MKKTKTFLLVTVSLFFLYLMFRESPVRHDFTSNYEEFTSLNKSGLHPSDNLLRHSYGLDPEDKVEIIHAINQLKKRIASEPGSRSQDFVKSMVSLMDWDDELAHAAYKIGEKCLARPESNLKQGITITKSYETRPSVTAMVNEWYGEFKRFDKQGVMLNLDNRIGKDGRILGHPETIGCAEARCFMDRMSETYVVCVWKFNGDY